jgi:hypothetical protein
MGYRSPYLANVPSLPSELRAVLATKRPGRAALARARRAIAALRQTIRRARERYELQTGRVIYVAPPYAPD